MTRSKPTRGRGYAMSNGMLLIAAPIIAYGSTVVTGTGWSPLIYLVFGPTIAITVSAGIRRRMGDPLLGQFAMLMLLALASAAVGYVTANPNPVKPFAAIFKTSPPASVSELRARVQWYDGQTILVRFRADETTMASLLKSGEFRSDDGFDELEPSRRTSHVDAAFNMSGIADREWRKTIAFQTARLYRSSPGHAATHPIDDCTLLVNERGEAWAMYNWGG